MEDRESMFEERTKAVRRFLLLLDVGVIASLFLLSYWVHQLFFGAGAADFLSHVALLPLIVFLWGVFLSACGAYRSPRWMSRFDYAWAVLRAVVSALAVLLTLLFLFRIQYVSRAIVINFSIASCVLLTAARFGVLRYFRRSLQRGENFRKAVIIGTGQRAIHLAETLKENSEWGINIIGHLDPEPARVGMAVLDAKVLGVVDDITSILKDHVVDDVILAIPRTMIPNVERIAQACEEEGVKFRLMADVFDVNVARMSLVEIGTIPLLTLEPVALDESKLMVKRAADLVLVLLAMPLLIPLFLVVAAAVKLDSPGPVFFMQERVGLNKRRFRMFKFRSMVQDGEKLMAQMEHLNEAEGPIFKIKNDPRVTRVGKFLRKTSIDELPQLINVLRGEMSLVGPRPMSIRDVDLFDKGIQRKRFSVKPGLTCLWQISGRSQLPFAKWLELDLFYIQHWSLTLDMKILVKTIPAVLKGTGAT